MTYIRNIVTMITEWSAAEWSATVIIEWSPAIGTGGTGRHWAALGRTAVTTGLPHEEKFAFGSNTGRNSTEF